MRSARYGASSSGRRRSGHRRSAGTLRGPARPRCGRSTIDRPARWRCDCGRTCPGGRRSESACASGGTRRAIQWRKGWTRRANGSARADPSGRREATAPASASRPAPPCGESRRGRRRHAPAGGGASRAAEGASAVASWLPYPFFDGSDSIFGWRTLKGRPVLTLSII